MKAFMSGAATSASILLPFVTELNIFTISVSIVLGYFAITGTRESFAEEMKAKGESK